MFWFKKRKIEQAMQCDREEKVEIEVVESKAKVHESTTKSKKDIDKLNRLLRADGITLKIHIAAGGHRGH